MGSQEIIELQRRIDLLESKHELHRKLAIANLELAANAMKSETRLRKFALASSVIIRSMEDGTANAEANRLFAEIVQDILTGKS